MYVSIEQSQINCQWPHSGLIPIFWMRKLRYWSIVLVNDLYLVFQARFLALTVCTGDLCVGSSFAGNLLRDTQCPGRGDRWPLKVSAEPPLTPRGDLELGKSLTVILNLRLRVHCPPSTVPDNWEIEVSSSSSAILVPLIEWKSHFNNLANLHATVLNLLFIYLVLCVESGLSHGAHYICLFFYFCFEPAFLNR